MSEQRPRGFESVLALTRLLNPFEESLGGLSGRSVLPQFESGKFYSAVAINVKGGAADVIIVG